MYNKWDIPINIFLVTTLATDYVCMIVKYLWYRYVKFLFQKINVFLFQKKIFITATKKEENLHLQKLYKILILTYKSPTHTLLKPEDPL